MGKVMGDLSSRRGKIIGIDTDGAFQVIKASVPTKELYHYSSTLRSLTGGRGVHTEEFSHYEEMPRDAAEKVIEEAERKAKPPPKRMIENPGESRETGERRVIKTDWAGGADPRGTRLLMNERHLVLCARRNKARPSVSRA